MHVCVIYRLPVPVPYGASPRPARVCELTSDVGYSDGELILGDTSHNDLGEPAAMKGET